MQPRTKRQKEVLDFITRHLTSHGYGPSYTQIARQLGINSKAGIARHIVALEAQGLISRRRENGSFSLILHSQNAISDSVCRIELLDSSSADARLGGWGRTNLALPKLLLGSLSADDVFAFRITDDSMTDKHLHESDIILFERRSYARRGDIVVAIAEDERVLIGQFYQNGSETEIRPANSNYESMMFLADKIIIHGVMRGMLRPIACNEH